MYADVLWIGCWYFAWHELSSFGLRNEKLYLHWSGRFSTAHLQDYIA